MDLISIIVPAYKVEPYLDRCIRSIAEQTYTNLEIILVDDGSPDNCPAMCDAWAAKDSRIRVIHKENGGLSDARNAGMAVANGDYIAFVDSDDWVERDYIGAMYRALKDTDADIAACDVRWVWEQKLPEPIRAVEYPRRKVSRKEALTELVENRGFRQVAWNKLYKKEMLAGERYPVGRLHEDEFFTYRILDKAQRLVYVEAPLYNYLQRSGSIMQTPSPKRVVDAMDAYYERLVYFSEKDPAFAPRLKGGYCISCALFYHGAMKADTPEAKQIKQHIRACRKRISVSPRELRQCTMKHQYYILGTRLCMGAVCKILDWRLRKAKLSTKQASSDW